MTPTCIYDRFPSPRDFSRMNNPFSLLNPREELIKEVCRQNPHDTQLLKKCALALIRMSHVAMRDIDIHVAYERHLAREKLIEAKSMLEKVLETDQDDHEARSNLGILQAELDMRISNNRNKLCKKAIECSEKTRDEVDGMEYYGMENMRAVRRYKQDCMDAEIRNTSNPNDAHNLRRWGRALMGLYRRCAYTNLDEFDEFDELIERINPQYYIEEAVEKFEAAVLLEPDDTYSKLQLALARIQNCYNINLGEAMKLSKECDLLEAELSSSRKASPMDVNESGRGAAFGVEYSGRSTPSGPSISHPIAPTKYNPHRFFSVERGMRSGVQRFGIPAAATQKRWLTKGGTRFRITGFLLQQLISRV